MFSSSRVTMASRPRNESASCVYMFGVAACALVAAVLVLHAMTWAGLTPVCDLAGCGQDYKYRSGVRLIDAVPLAVPCYVDANYTTCCSAVLAFDGCTHTIPDLPCTAPLPDVLKDRGMAVGSVYDVVARKDATTCYPQQLLPASWHTAYSVHFLASLLLMSGIVLACVSTCAYFYGAANVQYAAFTASVAAQSHAAATAPRSGDDETDELLEAQPRA